MFSLGNFEGPLDLLWQLVTKEEIDIATVPLHEITSQFSTFHKSGEPSRINEGAEFIALTAALIWYKSLRLLPKMQHATEEIPPPIEEGSANILHHLIDYCRFKQAAKELSSLESQQSHIYHRGIETEVSHTPPIGIHHISLDDLAKLFQKILAKAKPHIKTLREDPWKVSDKITFLLNFVDEGKKEPFENIFHPELSREELIVTFLALLELMKAGKLTVTQVGDSYVVAKTG